MKDISYGTNPILMVDMKYDASKYMELIRQLKLQQPDGPVYGISPIQIEIPKFKEIDTRYSSFKAMTYYGYSLKSPTPITQKSVDSFNKEVDKVLNRNVWLRIFFLILGIIGFILIW